MKWIQGALVVLAVLLSGCWMVDPDGVKSSRTATGWTVESTVGPGVVIGSSADITRFDGPCRYQITTAGDKRSVACRAPSVVTIQNGGANIAVRVLSVDPLAVLPRVIQTAGVAIDLGALFLAMMNTLLTFSGGAIPALLIAWFLNNVADRIPFLRPFKQVVKAYLENLIELYQLEQAKRAVLGAEQVMNAQLKQQFVHIGSRVDGETERFKAERNELALKTIARIAPDRANLLRETAVSVLKSEGKL